jgi:autoinducer 2-degrading protein
VSAVKGRMLRLMADATDQQISINAADFGESPSRTLAPKRERMKTAGMLIVHVHVQVKPESLADFIEATTENARNSLREPGIARFDVAQQSDDPTRFILVEVYRDEAATKAHKETSHYAKWRDTVAPMMSGPRSSVKFSNVFPADIGW